MRLEMSRDTNALPIPDTTFKLSAVHYFVLNFAKEHEDVFSQKDYRAYVREKIPDKKAQTRAVTWNATTVRKMTEAGYLIDKGREEYAINPLALTVIGEKQPQQKEFSLKPNHRKLLSKHLNGVIMLSELKAEYEDKSPREQLRQSRMIDGMVRALKNNGFLINTGRGVYRLTDEALYIVNQPAPKPERSRRSGGVTVTVFDRLLLEVSENGEIKPDLLSAHPRGESLKKRIITLANAGFIRDNRLNDELLERIGIAQARNQCRSISLDRLTVRQQQVITELRLFLNLTMTQIIKHIYDGNAELAKADMRYLVDRDILKKDTAWKVYILSKEGVKLTNTLFPDSVRYKTKLYSRWQEVGHDVRVYSAYKDFEARILADGMEIRDIKNDRQMRSEDAKRYGTMVGRYPDLRVTYYDPKTRRVFTHDIEMDCGYDEKTITSKLTGIFGGASGSSGSGSAYSGLSWYTNSVGQAKKVMAAMNNLTRENDKTLHRTKHLFIYIMNEKMELKKVKWN